MIIKTGFIPNVRLGNVFRSPRPNLKARACARFFPLSFRLIAVAGQNPSIKECKKSHKLWLKSPTTYDVARCARDRGRKMLRGMRQQPALRRNRFPHPRQMAMRVRLTLATMMPSAPCASQCAMQPMFCFLPEAQHLPNENVEVCLI